jgi:hypothetical protein
MQASLPLHTEKATSSKQCITQADYARRIGVSPRYVFALKEMGVIVLTDDRLVDPDQADAAIAARRDRSKPLQRKGRPAADGLAIKAICRDEYRGALVECLTGIVDKVGAAWVSRRLTKHAATTIGALTVNRIIDIPLSIEGTTRTIQSALVTAFGGSWEDAAGACGLSYSRIGASHVLYRSIGDVGELHRPDPAFFEPVKRPKRVKSKSLDPSVYRERSIAALQRAVDALGVFFPSLPIKSEIDGLHAVAAGAKPQGARLCASGTTLRSLRGYWGGSWSQWADAAGLVTAQIHVDGHYSRTAIFSADTTADDVKRALGLYAVTRASWFEFGGNRHLLDRAAITEDQVKLPDCIRAATPVNYLGDWLDKSGVYAIVNVKRMMFYIGSSVSIGARLSDHRSSLRTGRHENHYLQNSWRKHGEQSFCFVVIEVTNSDDRVEREQHYIDLTRCWDRRIGYNRAANANGGVTGEAVGNSMLTEGDVRRMRWERAMFQTPYSQIAESYGVAKCAARAAISGRTWGHLEGALGVQDKQGRSTVNALLDDEQVVAMRAAYSKGDEFGDVAEQYGVSANVARNAITGETYGHVPGQVDARPVVKADPYDGRDLCDITGKPMKRCASLTAECVIEMRRLRKAGGITYRELGDRFGVTKKTAMMAVQGAHWSIVDSIESPVDDKGLSGLMPKGEANSSSKLTRAQVLEMRVLRKSGIGVKRLSKMFGVGENAAQRATDGRSWAHLNDVEPPFVWGGQV